MQIGVDDNQALRLLFANLLRKGHTPEEIQQHGQALLIELSAAHQKHGDRFMAEEIKRIQLQGGRSS